jgi:glycosyltransferase involved in cell wall biosynthesis
MSPICFSVLMAVYYREDPDFLDRALDSVLNQSLLPREIVLVKDGKLTEELDVVVAKYRDRICMVIVELPENRGLGLALQQGLLQCSYEYIVRCDSDDINRPDRFSKQISYLTNHPTIDCLGSWIMEFNTIDNNDIIEDNTTKNKRVLPLDHDAIKKYVKYRNPMNHMTVAFKRQSVLDSGGYADVPYFEDYYLWIRMIENNCKFSNIPEVLVLARRNEEFFHRRRGWKYITHELKFQSLIYKLRLITFGDLLRNLILRIPPKTLPSNLIRFLYSTLLRST